jgi:hypothetical protein
VLLSASDLTTIPRATLLRSSLGYPHKATSSSVTIEMTHASALVPFVPRGFSDSKKYFVEVRNLEEMTHSRNRSLYSVGQVTQLHRFLYAKFFCVSHTWKYSLAGALFFISRLAWTAHQIASQFAWSWFSHPTDSRLFILQASLWRSYRFQ